MLQCVILAGGLGTRMRPFTLSMPKALVPVLGRPFVDWQLALLSAQGIERVVFCAGHGATALRAHVGDGARFGVSATWVDEGENLRGTAGALRLAIATGALDAAFFVLYGDSYLPTPMSEVLEAWRASELPALMTVLRNDDSWDASNAVYAGGRVLLYDKRRPADRRGQMRWIDYGLSILTRDLLLDSTPDNAVSDLADVFRMLSLKGQLAGFEVRERFYEVGSPVGLRDLERYLSTGLQG